MEISLFDSWSRKFSTVAITGYQKYLSPHKGFSCAHRVLYGGESCSQYIKRVIAEEGLSVALDKSRQRFQACKQANLLLRSLRVERSPSHRLSPVIGNSLLQIENSEFPEEPDDSFNDEEEDRESRSSEKSSPSQTSGCSQNSADCGRDCSHIDCADLTFLDCSGADCSIPDCGDLSHCSSLDCSGADCGALDCGSCGN